MRPDLRTPVFLAVKFKSRHGFTRINTDLKPKRRIGRQNPRE
jgi:hypothetical protein